MRKGKPELFGGKIGLAMRGANQIQMLVIRLDEFRCQDSTDVRTLLAVQVSIYMYCLYVLWGNHKYHFIPLIELRMYITQESCTDVNVYITV